MFYLLFYFLQLDSDLIDLLDGEGKALDQVCLKLLPSQGECTLVLNNTSQLLGAEKHPVKIFPVFYQRFLKGFSIFIIISLILLLAGSLIRKERKLTGPINLQVKTV